MPTTHLPAATPNAAAPRSAPPQAAPLQVPDGPLGEAGLAGEVGLGEAGRLPLRPQLAPEVETGRKFAHSGGSIPGKPARSLPDVS